MNWDFDIRELYMFKSLWKHIGDNSADEKLKYNYSIVLKKLPDFLQVKLFSTSEVI